MSIFDCVYELANARLQLIVTALDGAALPGEVWLYGGTRPTTRGGVTAEPVQCVIALPRPCAVVVDAVLTLSEAEGERVADAPLTWGRLVDGAGKTWADFDVSTVAAGTGALQLNTVVGAIGDLVRIVSGTLSE